MLEVNAVTVTRVLINVSDVANSVPLAPELMRGGRWGIIASEVIA